MNLPDTYRGNDLTGRPALSIPFDSASGAAADRLNMRVLISMFRRRLLMFVTIVLIFLMLALLFTVRQPKQYIAAADVVIDTQQAQVTPESPGTAVDTPPRAEEIDTKLKVIASQDMAARVVDDLKLASDPAFLKFASRGGGLTATVRAALGLKPQTIPISTENLRRSLNDVLLSRLKTSRIETAYAIRIAYTDINPVRAAAVANAFARLYASYQVSSKSAENQKTTALLQSRIDELRQQAQSDFSAVQNFRIRNNLLSADATALTEQEITNYNQQLALARAEAAQSKSRLGVASEQLAAGSAGDDIGEALSSPVIQSLRAQRAGVSARVAELSGRYLDGHPDLAKAKRELSDIDGQIQDEVSRTLSGLMASALASGQRVATLQGNRNTARSALASNNAALIGLDDLNRRALASQALYESYLGRYKAVVAESGTERADARVISPAKVPGIPSSPKLPLNLALGLVLGTLVAAGAALATESAYAGLTTGEDVEQRLGIRYLGSVPMLSTLTPRGSDALDTVASYPGSFFTESFRNLLTSIRQSNNSRNQVVAVTSALPGEGKTSISACLARAAAMNGERVVVIDCDLVRPNLGRMMLLDSGRPGLREVLRSGALIGDAIVKDQVTNAMVLPITVPFKDDERLLDKGHFHRLVALLREEFDLIILDAAPILPVAETRELVAIADNLVVAALWRKTSDVAIRSALKLLPLRAIGDVGIVLSRVDMKKQARFGYGDATSFYRSYKQYYSGA